MTEPCHNDIITLVDALTQRCNLQEEEEEEVALLASKEGTRQADPEIWCQSEKSPPQASSIHQPTLS
jgi:hypothetical protein